MPARRFKGGEYDRPTVGARAPFPFIRQPAPVPGGPPSWHTRRAPQGPAPVPEWIRKKTRQRPTLPLSCPSSTIGTGGLNCRVRNGNGCCPAVKVAGINCSFFVLINFMVKPHGLLVLVSSIHHWTYTPSLSTSSSTRDLQPFREGDLILGSASRLYAFSGYHVRT